MPFSRIPLGIFLVNKVNFFFVARETNPRGTVGHSNKKELAIILGFGFMLIEFKEVPRKWMFLLGCMLQKMRAGFFLDDRRDWAGLELSLGHWWWSLTLTDKGKFLVIFVVVQELCFHCCCLNFCCRRDQCSLVFITIMERVLVWCWRSVRVCSARIYYSLSGSNKAIYQLPRLRPLSFSPGNLTLNHQVSVASYQAFGAKSWSEENYDHLLWASTTN